MNNDQQETIKYRQIRRATERKEFNTPTKKTKAPKHFLSNAPKIKSKTFKSFLICKRHWPKVFNSFDSKPVAVGIRFDLLDDAKKRGLPVSNSTIYNALFWLTSTVQYKESLLRDFYRYDIDGEICGKISPEHKEKADLALKNISVKTKEIADSVQAKDRKKIRDKKNKNLSSRRNSHPTKISFKAKRKAPLEGIAPIAS